MVLAGGGQHRSVNVDHIEASIVNIGERWSFDHFSNNGQ